MEEYRPTVGGIFSGIGGALLGAHWAGYNIQFNSESRSFFNLDTFKTNFPHKINYYPTLEEIPKTKVDLIIGSPNCKQFSNLGTKRKDRGKLHEYSWDEFDVSKFFIRIKELEPASFILENVPNILKTFWFEDNTLCFVGAPDSSGHVLSLPHYKIQVTLLDAFDFGVAQHRKRVFFVGSRIIEPKFDLDALLKTDFIEIFNRYKKYKTVDEALSGVDKLYNMEKPNHTIARIAGFRILKFGESYYGTQNNKRLHPDKPSGVIASHCSRFVHPYNSRVLTVRENARLMGFPDHFIFKGRETGQLDQVGKSIVPQVSMALAYYLKREIEDAR
jgi:DNA (cytosine-5)-methyltransferase 1